ncbi:MAG: hypothetical protein ACLFUS_14090 [Candidatus Sumerlaeia bacterium]
MNIPKKRSGKGLGNAALRVFLVLSAMCLMTASSQAQSLLDRMKSAAKNLSPNSTEGEAVDVEDALSDLKDLAGEGADLEILEEDQAQPLALDDEKMRRLLGEDPTFIYQPKVKTDPMLVPWSRLRVISEEAGRLAEAAQAGARYEDAMAAYAQVLYLLESAPENWAQNEKLIALKKDLEENVGDLEEIRQRGGFPSANDTGEAKLPIWIQNNTRGVIADEGTAVCLVGTHTLHPGDIVPDPSTLVVVEAINEETVKFRVRDKIFEVSTREGE